MEALVFGQMQRLPVMLPDEVVIGVVRQIGMDTNRIVVSHEKPALVERPVVVLAEAETIAKVVGTAFTLWVNVGGLDDGGSIPWPYAPTPHTAHL